MPAAPRNIALYTLAGVFTAPRFMDEFHNRMLERLAAEGFSTYGCSIFPYGDWGSSRLRQAAEVAVDVCVPIIGGRRAEAIIRETCDRADAIVLIGHSGGGVAAVQAARTLLSRGEPVLAVVMIGAPRTPIPLACRDRTLYLYSTGRQGKVSDRITEFGRWGGNKPARVLGLPLVGGHRDYFRANPPFVNEHGLSNLSITVQATAAWLLERLILPVRQTSL
jgi:pimeloyl-ACP methyl ester carboxylesterase